MWDILKVIDRVNSLPAFEEGILPMESTSEDHLHCSRLPDLVQTFISNGLALLYIPILWVPSVNS